MKLPNESKERITSTFDSANLGDPRRLKRLEKILCRLAEKPQESIPSSMGSEAGIEGAYRFMNNGKVDPAELNAAHGRETAIRSIEAGRVLAIHDTTSISCPHSVPEEVGYLSTGKPGFYFHYTLVVPAGSRKPLGVIDSQVQCREQKSKRKGRRRRPSGAETIRDKERESLKWWRGFSNASELLEGCDELIHVADREADSYELIAQSLNKGLRFIIRVRALDRNVILPDGSKSKFPLLLESSKGIFSKQVPISSRKSQSAPRESRRNPPRSARIAKLQYSVTKAQIKAPQYLKKLAETVTVNVVYVNEVDPPDGEKPIRWILTTSEPINTTAEVEFIVDSYRARWTIEECNKAIKTGCTYEKSQFESRHALQVLLALTLPIACELLWVRSMARENPDTPAQQVINPTRLKILRELVPNKLGRHPTARGVLMAIAGLGGHKKSNGEPGWLVLHRGMRELAAYERGWNLAMRVQNL